MSIITDYNTMKIIAHTKDGDALLKAINAKMKKNNTASQEGKLKTWEIVLSTKNQILYNHTPEQWSLKAIIQPVKNSLTVEFNIGWLTKFGEPNEETKGYYLGRFVEILMVNFKKYFNYLEIQ